MGTLIELQNLRKYFSIESGFIKKVHVDLKAVDGVSFRIEEGDTFGLVGESGCGKSTLGKALMRLHTGPARITAGELWFDGRDLMTLPQREMPEIRGAEIGMVFQDPMTSLNPVQRILDHIT